MKRLKKLQGLNSYKSCPHLHPVPQEEEIRRTRAQRFNFCNVVTFLTLVTLTQS
jgi:hypothetical protein